MLTTKLGARLRKAWRTGALSPALLYAAFGAAWIAVSDHVLGLLSADVAVLQKLQTLKGGAFVAASSVLFYVLLDRALRRARWVRARGRSAERRFKTLCEKALVGIYLVQDERFVYVNERHAEIFGYTREELLRGRRPLDLVAPEDRPLAAENIRRRLSGEAQSVHYAVRGLRRDGAIIRLDALGSRIELDGRPAIIGTVLDVTERFELERKYLQAQKLEVVGRLVAGIAHDFNNLLTAIRGYGELVLHELEAAHPSRPDVQEILAAAERSSALTRQLLGFSRSREEQAAAPLDVSAAVHERQLMIERLVGEHIEAAFVLRPDAGSARIDASRLEQVLLNLVVNASDAMPKGGRLTVETASVAVDEDDHPELRRGSYVLLAVTDTGTGMEPALAARIFEPFFTTKGEMGTGLGLASVQDILRKAGGEVRVYTEPGRGTTFKVYLPADAARPPSPPAGPAAPPEGARVLVVEDDAALRRFLTRTLGERGHRVVEAGSAAEARAAAGRARPDLLLTDVALPDGEGPSLAGELGVRTVLMSGFAEAAALRSGLAPAGAVFLAKPFGRQELLARVRQALGRTPPVREATPGDGA